MPYQGLVQMTCLLLIVAIPYWSPIEPFHFQRVSKPSPNTRRGASAIGMPALLRRPEVERRDEGHRCFVPLHALTKGVHTKKYLYVMAPLILMIWPYDCIIHLKRAFKLHWQWFRPTYSASCPRSGGPELQRRRGILERGMLGRVWTRIAWSERSLLRLWA